MGTLSFTTLKMGTPNFLLSLPSHPPSKIYCQKSVAKNNTTKKLPPGPMKLPLIGNLHNLMGSIPHHALRELALEHGPLMHLQLGEVSTVVVSSPRMAEEVMKKHDFVFAQRPELQVSKIISYGGLDIAFSKGEYWRQMRKLCATEILGAKRVRSFSSLRQDEVSNLMESIRLSAGSPFNFTERMFLLTSNITGRAAIGNKREDKEAIISLTKEIVTLAAGFDVGDLFPSLEFLHVISGLKPKLEKLHKQLDNILEKIVNEHKKKLMSAKGGNDEPEKEHLVDVLLRLQQDGSRECPIANINIKAVICAVLAAGIDSSATTLEWAMSELMKCPRVMEKAQVEVREAFKGKKTVSETDIQGLKYLKSVIKETLRLHPPGTLLFPRESRERCEIGGYEIAAKTKVIVNAWAIGRDAEYWDDAENFIPERFDDGAIDFMGMNYEFIPFGAGRRICPGILFGLANIEVPLAKLLYHFNWKLPDGITPQNLDMSECFGGTTTRKSNLYLIASPHLPS